MITIQHNPGEIVVSGHANYAESGKDIVCAAISTLFQVFIASVEELTADEIKCAITANKAVLSYGSLSETSKALLSSFFIGCRMVANEYPNNVKLLN